ncbi:hypothetical protein MGN70_004254 [Eutypa lata]|uniref:Putative cyanovirin-n family protein n=1 Tax=Eutypa lata (strain UCR-EL1) TaxID=1287681 RepID=M7T3D3_EUTLA|nr:putative cyanovirin-n family protein [Eutypa lata UCREL1]KAI1253859.1 hypothetical protein MGN70_004254 [Eutypa lata]
MSFNTSSQDVRIEGGHILKARVQNEGGDFVDSEINLNDFLGNDDGRFDWSGQNFSETAENISFSIEGGADVPVLRARLQKLDGEYVDADVNLAERVSNDNGRLSFS